MDLLDQLIEGQETASAEATRALASRMAPALPPNCALALHGDLGAGKTTFVSGMAAGLGITQTVTSPTYTVYSLYEGTRQLLHLDAYRLQSNAEAEDLLLDQFLQPPFLLAVEWPDKISGFLSDYPVFHLDLTIISPDHHQIRLRNRHPQQPS